MTSGGGTEIMANTFARPHGVTVDIAEPSLLQSATVGRGPISDIAADAGTLVVTNFGDNTLAVLDAETLSVRGGVATGQPFAVAVSDARAYVAVSSASDDAVTVIDTDNGKIVTAYPMAGNVTAVAATSDGKRVYAARARCDGVDVAVIDVIAERVAIIDVSKAPDATIDALRVDAAGRRLFIATSDSRSSRVIVVDVESGHVRGSIELGAPIRGLELGFDSTAYVLTSDIEDRGVLHVLDLVANRVYATLSVGTAPMQLALSPDGTRAFVVDYDQVHVVCTETRAILGGVSVGARPSCIAVGPERLYVADYAGGLTAYAVAVPAPMLYSQFVAANSTVAPQVRELQPAGV
jgi:DNA-binding beta-propeller fold protein YncE